MSWNAVLEYTGEHVYIFGRELSLPAKLPYSFTICMG